MARSGEQLGPVTTEQVVQKELGARVYTKAEELRSAALARLGLSEESLDPLARHKVTLQTGDYRLKVEIGNESQINVNESTMRTVSVRHNPYQGEEFKFARYVEPNGAMWQQADSSQGEPWYPAQLPVAELSKMIDCLDQLEASNYWVEVSISGRLPVRPAQETAA